MNKSINYNVFKLCILFCLANSVELLYEVFGVPLNHFHNVSFLIFLCPLIKSIHGSLFAFIVLNEFTINSVLNLDFLLSIGNTLMLIVQVSNHSMISLNQSNYIIISNFLMFGASDRSISISLLILEVFSYTRFDFLVTRRRDLSSHIVS